ncbi:hypothetical protein D9M71_742590 [compost metagenome]
MDSAVVCPYADVIGLAVEAVDDGGDFLSRDDFVADSNLHCVISFLIDFSSSVF